MRRVFTIIEVLLVIAIIGIVIVTIAGIYHEKATAAASKPVTGGNAFPTNYYLGMTLRDYFAGQALVNGYDPGTCYRLADRMIQIRGTTLKEIAKPIVIEKQLPEEKAK